MAEEVSLKEELSAFINWQKQMDYEERAAIKEYEGNMSRWQAEMQAREEVFGKKRRRNV